MADSWASLIFLLTLVVILGAVGTRVGPRLQKFPDGQPLVQGQLANRNVQALDCMHFTPSRCIQHWGVVKGKGPEVTAGPVFLGPPADGFSIGVLPSSD